MPEPSAVWRRETAALLGDMEREVVLARSRLVADEAEQEAARRALAEVAGGAGRGVGMTRWLVRGDEVWIDAALPEEAIVKYRHELPLHGGAVAP